MKIFEYIENSEYLNNSNCMNLLKFGNEILSIIENNKNKYTSLDYTEDFLEYNDINIVFENLKNRIIILLNVDIDFPPPNKPYSYDLYFKKYILPFDYEKINYYQKINAKLYDIIEKNNLHVFSYSLSMNHNNSTFLPLGVTTKFNYFNLKNNCKDILCYLNFGLPCDRWFGNPRKDILKILENKSFITKKNGLDDLSYYTDISKSKFSICPRGCGIDTYRMWESIVLGCIPIVEKYDAHEQFIDLPILFLNKIEDYHDLEEAFLNEKYEEFLQKDFNYEKCKISYWINKIVCTNVR